MAKKHEGYPLQETLRRGPEVLIRSDSMKNIRTGNGADIFCLSMYPLSDG